MPSSSGVYSLPLGYLAVTGQVILPSQHNPPLEDIAAALTGRLSRDGTAAMTGSVRAVSGSAAAPGYTFAVDITTGLSKTTNGIGIDIGGVQVAEFTAAGMASGNRLIGELVEYTGSVAPSSLWVFPCGQTVSRTAYPALWAFSQIEIAAGNLLYNTVDGSTTFGIPDKRGRVSAGWDAMGGTAAGRLTTATVSSAALGAVGGAQTTSLGTSNMASYTPSGSVSTSVSSSLQGVPLIVYSNGGTNTPGTGANQAINGGIAATFSASSSFSGNNNGGTSTPFSNVQPTLVCNYLLFAGGAS
jgi:microcystin-dependent protein